MNMFIPPHLRVVPPHLRCVPEKKPASISEAAETAAETSPEQSLDKAANSNSGATLEVEPPLPTTPKPQVERLKVPTSPKIPSPGGFINVEPKKHLTTDKGTPYRPHQPFMTLFLTSI
jgi:hypothetical protein